MKKRTIALAALAFGVAITSYSVAGTYAKYTSKIGNGAANTRVAKWFNTEGNETIELDVFNTSTFTSSSKISENVIAPGTYGVVELSLPASQLDAALSTSSVEVAYDLIPSITVTDGTNGKIHFWISETATPQDEKTASPETKYYSGNSGYELKELGAALNEAMTVEANAKETIAQAVTRASKPKKYLHWAWDFDDDTKGTNDSTDTDLGKIGTAEVKLELNLQATQVNPAS